MYFSNLYSCQQVGRQVVESLPLLRRSFRKLLPLTDCAALDRFSHTRMSSVERPLSPFTLKPKTMYRQSQSQVPCVASAGWRASPEPAVSSAGCKRQSQTDRLDSPAATVRPSSR